MAFESLSVGPLIQDFCSLHSTAILTVNLIRTCVTGLQICYFSNNSRSSHCQTTVTRPN